MILEEQPSKVSEAVKLFLQGLGYTTVRSLHTSRIRTAVSLAGTPVKKPPPSTTSSTTRPSIIEPSPKVSGDLRHQQHQGPAQTSDLIGGLAELMLKEPLTKPITPQ